MVGASASSHSRGCCSAQPGRGCDGRYALAAGRPLTFMAVLDDLHPLDRAANGRVRWVAQLVSAHVPDFRFYVQFNGENDLSIARGSVVMVANGVLIAGGTTPRTDGGSDDTLYVLAQNLRVLIP